MSVETRTFGTTPSGAKVTEYTIKNGKITAKVIDFGAILTQLIVPDKNGKEADVVLGYDNLEAYLDNGYFFGSTIGPSANRVAKATGKIDGVIFHLPVNENANNLHTDINSGLHKKMWKAEAGENSVKFSIELPDGEYGLPGNRKVEVTYTINDENGLVLSYHMTSDKKTIMNLTNHSYFNLGGHDSGLMTNQELQMNCSAFTVVDNESIPTGEVRLVEGTVFDFRNKKAIGKDINAEDEQLGFTGGYDHNFVIDGHENGRARRLAVTASDPVSGRVMEVYTDLPGVQFYAGNFIQKHEGKGGAQYDKRHAFCLETQFWPDAINHDNFEKPIFGGDNEMISETEYRFK